MYICTNEEENFLSFFKISKNLYHVARNIYTKTVFTVFIVRCVGYTASNSRIILNVELERM